MGTRSPDGSRVLGGLLGHIKDGPGEAMDTGRGTGEGRGGAGRGGGGGVSTRGLLELPLHPTLIFGVPRAPPLALLLWAARGT